MLSAQYRELRHFAMQSPRLRVKGDLALPKSAYFNFVVQTADDSRAPRAPSQSTIAEKIS